MVQNCYPLSPHGDGYLRPDIFAAPPRRITARGKSALLTVQLKDERPGNGKVYKELAYVQGCSTATMCRIHNKKDQKTGGPRGRPLTTTREQRDVVPFEKVRDPFGKHRCVAGECVKQGINLMYYM